ncbi:hypothetical protein MNBD_GAMMA07-2021, partial [hydrothermal vent metagenome]
MKNIKINQIQIIKRILYITLFVFSSMVLAIPSNADDYKSILNYKIGPGDLLNISVWKEEGL